MCPRRAKPSSEQGVAPGLQELWIASWPPCDADSNSSLLLWKASPKDDGFSLWVGKIPWRRKWQPTPVLLPGKSHGQRSLVGYIQSMGSQRVGFDWATSLSLSRMTADSRKWFYRGSNSSWEERCGGKSTKREPSGFSWHVTHQFINQESKFLQGSRCPKSQIWAWSAAALWTFL